MVHEDTTVAAAAGVRGNGGLLAGGQGEVRICLPARLKALHALLQELHLQKLSKAIIRD